MPIRIPLLVALNVAVALWFLTSIRDGSWSLDVYRADLDVYRRGADMWLRGGDLYGVLDGTNMPFTYPPISAVLLAPFAVVPFGVASAVLAGLTIAAVAVVLGVVLRSLHAPRTLLPALLPAALLLEPVRTTFHYGQVNALLMALVAVDCLVRRPRWPRGVLVGLAAAIKLTPGLFVLFFLVRGDRKAVVTTGVSFLCASGVGFLLDWPGSVKYWTESMFRIDRIGEPVRAANQSIMGLLARLGVESSVLWVLGSAALLGATAIAMRRACAAGQPAWALALCAAGTLPVAPISWSHHWVWCVPILLCLGVTAWRSRNTLTCALAGGGLLLFTLSPHWWFANTAPWTVDRMLLGNTYLLFTVVTIAYAARPAHRPAPTRALAEI